MSDKLEALLTEVSTNQRWLMEDHKETKSIIKEHVKDEKAWQDQQNTRHAEHGKRIGNLEAELYMRAKIRGVAKTLLIALVAVLTFKFGDVTGILKGMWK